MPNFCCHCTYILYFTISKHYLLVYENKIDFGTLNLLSSHLVKSPLSTPVINRLLCVFSFRQGWCNSVPWKRLGERHIYFRCEMHMISCITLIQRRKRAVHKSLRHPQSGCLWRCLCRKCLCEVLLSCPLIAQVWVKLSKCFFHRFVSLWYFVVQKFMLNNSLKTYFYFLKSK